ncbi:MAG: tetratricopeptide repeat protein [Verrucomicrobiota bacterium JB023]|nr:tetratricopeptide repeat protein [Verrucomicrobiota bacterium JB023]
MDKKLIIYLCAWVGLVVATFVSAQNMRNSQEGLSAEERARIIDEGNYEIDPITRDPIMPEPEKNESAAFITFGLFIITGVFTGFLVVTYVLPNLVQRASEEVLGSTEKVGKNPMAKAQALVAQGKWEEAIESYREAAEAEPDNRLPWVEIAMLQRERLDDPESALETLREALDRGGWRENDEAFFYFRKIDIHENEMKNREKAIALLRDVIEKFPQTRHSANAMHKLHELGES